MKNQGKILLTAVFIYGIATVLFGLSKSFYLSLLFLTITGAGDIVSTIIRNTIRQLITPDHLRGRMTSVNMIFFMGGPQLGELEAGVFAHLLGTPTSVVIGGVGTMFVTLLMAILIPKLRKYQGDEVLIS
jgi:MFS family permease